MAARQPIASVTPIEALLLSVLAATAENTAAIAANTAAVDKLHAALLERNRRPPSLSQHHRATLAKWLPALGGVYGSDQFSSRDLAEDTRPAVRLVVRGWSVKQISKLFARADGIPINGLMVQKHGVEFQVTVWQIVAC